MKRRIAILQNGLIRGGTERFVINLCKGLLKPAVGQYDIVVVNPSLLPEQQVLEPEVIATGATIQHTTTIQGITGRLKHLYLLYKLLRQGHYDVFHTNLDLFNGPNLFVAWLARVPIRICHAHASMQETEIRNGRTLAILFYQSLMRWMCWTFANRHIGCSDEANDFLYAGHDWRNASYPTVIFNGIDLDLYRRDKSIEPLALKYILAIGRFVTQKNPDFILDIMEQLQLMQSNIRLLWVGDGQLHEHVEGEISARALDNIDLLGWRDEIPALMQRSNLLLMPSLFEGLSITLIEAQASGLPCLVSDTITKQAQCGLIKYKSLADGATSWAQEIIHLLAPLEPFAPLNSPKDLAPLQRFSIEHMALQFEQVLI